MILNNLADKLKGYDIQLTQQQWDLLERDAECLLKKNEVMNLTAITQPEQMEDRHFVDSLFLAAQPEVRGSLIDIGSGAGFPGVVVKIYRPEVEITLLESIEKKARYLQELADTLQLELTVLNDRAESVGRGDRREQYDVATARAVAGLPVLCEYALPLVKVGGCFIAMKTGDSEEVESAERAIGVLGGKLEAERPYTLPDGSERRLLFINKVKPTPPQYPRATAAIKKKPL